LKQCLHAYTGRDGDGLVPARPEPTVLLHAPHSDPGQQVLPTAGGPTDPATRLSQHCASAVEDLPVHDRRPVAGGRDRLPPVHRHPGVPVGHEQLPDGGTRPCLPAPCGHARGVPGLGNGVQAAPGKDGAVGLPDHHRLSRFEGEPVAVLPVPERDRRPGRGPGLGSLHVRSLLPGALALHLGPAYCTLDPGEQSTAVSGQIGLTADRRKGKVLPLGQVDEVLQFAGLPVEPVEVPGHDRADCSGLDVGEHPLIRRAGLLAGRAGVVVHVLRR
jgi:hypothetical protein